MNFSLIKESKNLRQKEENKTGEEGRQLANSEER